MINLFYIQAVADLSEMVLSFHDLHSMQQQDLEEVSDFFRLATISGSSSM